MRAPRSAARPRLGFSLIELMAVIVILGLIGTVAMVAWQALLPGAKVNAAIRNLSEVLSGARSEAISRNARFEVYYDLDQERYWVRTPFRVTGGLATASAEEERAFRDDTLLSEAGLQILQVKIDDEPYVEGQVFVRFDPLGASSAHTIVLYHKLFDATYTLEVLPLTGEVRVHDGLYERSAPRDGDFD
jgi:prepilin-type N-terminal cleavage/methylation domain-containing protein